MRHDDRLPRGATTLYLHRRRRPRGLERRQPRPGAADGSSSSGSPHSPSPGRPPSRPMATVTCWWETVRLEGSSSPAGINHSGTLAGVDALRRRDTMCLAPANVVFATEGNLASFLFWWWCFPPVLLSTVAAPGDHQSSCWCCWRQCRGAAAAGRNYNLVLLAFFDWDVSNITASPLGSYN